MRYGFLIDQNRCIGCHACTVACKEEHNIAVGVNRTWVKYIEKGRYPDTRRHFAVLRCNHCDDAPCIEICPTVALFRRPDGIVDFDHQHSTISKRIAMEKISVRKPEKGTKPKLFYTGVDGDLLNPTMMEPQTAHFWAEKTPGEDLYALTMDHRDRPIPGGAREVYDVPHATPWGKKIASYLWAKSISAGILLLSALLLNIGFEADAPLLHVIGPFVALLFLGVTFALLVLDLKKPGRFFYLLTKANLKSWLTLGGYVLMIYGVLAGIWLAQGLTQPTVSPLVFWPAALFAIASAGYSAFLFAQARGRDFWQSPLL